MEKLQLFLNQEAFNVWYFRGPEKAPIIHWAHATGFNGPTYSMLLNELSNTFHVYAWDARLHGHTQGLSQPKSKNFIQTYCDDLVNLIEVIYQKHNNKVILAGHSFGAALCIKAEQRLKNKISTLILADPVLFTPFLSLMSRLGRLIKLRKPKNMYLAQNAARRRNHWRSFDEIYVNYKKKVLFKKWPDEALKNYIKYGTKSSNSGVYLACPPEVESQIFLECENEFLFDSISKLNTPTTLVIADNGSPAFGLNAFKNSKAKIKTVKLSNETHFFPVENHKILTREVSKIFFSDQNVK